MIKELNSEPTSSLLSGLLVLLTPNYHTSQKSIDPIKKSTKILTSSLVGNSYLGGLHCNTSISVKRLISENLERGKRV
jgi:hypothetical protein